MKKIRMYKKPFITAAVFLISGFVMFAGGMYFADVKNESNYYALMVFGFLLIITAVIVFGVYGALERKFEKVMNQNVLINYVMSGSELEETAKREGDNIKTHNKTVLFIMLFFCVLFAVLGPFILEDGYIFSIISLGLGLFLTVAAFIITHYRVGKLKKGSELVVLSKGGAYVCGEFHCWSFLGTSLTGAEYLPPEGAGKPGFIKISYQSVTVPGPSEYTAMIPLKNISGESAGEIIGKLMQQQTFD